MSYKLDNADKKLENTKQKELKRLDDINECFRKYHKHLFRLVSMTSVEILKAMKNENDDPEDMEENSAKMEDYKRKLRIVPHDKLFHWCKDVTWDLRMAIITFDSEYFSKKTFKSRLKETQNIVDLL